jgi:hypothetical protein
MTDSIIERAEPEHARLLDFVQHTIAAHLAQHADRPWAHGRMGALTSSASSRQSIF